MSIIAVFLFFLYCWGIGFTATYYLKKPEHSWEKHLLNLGVGLGIIPILLITLNFLHISLDWKIIFALSVAFPFYILATKIKKKEFSFPKLQLKKSDLVIFAVVLIAAFSFYIYAKGAFSYPYLEDEDPWGHSVGMKFVSMEKYAYDPPLKTPNGNIDPVLSYIDPYPPAYDALLGILHQTSPDLPWTMKFFNALIISLGFIFFYLFANELMGSRNKALLATAILAMIPAYLSHFIWAHSLIITIFFPLMYALHKSMEDKRWLYLVVLLSASVWVTQNLEQPIKLTTMVLIYLMVFSIGYRKILWKQLAALAGGITLSFLWWGVMITKYGLKNFLAYYGGDVINTGDTIVLSSQGNGGFEPLSILVSAWQAATNPSGSASRTYSFSDFFFAKSQNMINNPIGIGVVLSILALVGVVLLIWKYRSSIVQKENTWRALVLFWLIFAFWGVNGLNFPISVARGAFRVWMLLAVAVSLIAAESIYLLKDSQKSKLFGYGIMLLVLAGILLTSGMQKFELNTVIWPTSGSFPNPSQPFQYGAWFDSIPDNTKVFLYSPRDKLVIGYGKFSCMWCQDLVDFREDIIHKDAKELYSFLKRNEYEYLVLNAPMDFKYLSSKFKEVENIEELINKRYQEILTAGYFTPIHKIDENIFVFKVN